MAELFDRSAAVVRRYGGTVDKFTGDGIMAVFGAPITLEDHALRACLAALDIQKDIGRKLALRVGLNSGQVIAGDVGSATANYTTVGEQVGMAQRMETAAPPGGVMLSESTARLVESMAVLGEPEPVHVKNIDEPVYARRLLSAGDHHPRRLTESRLVGRRVGTQYLQRTVGRSRRRCRLCGRCGGSAGHRKKPTGPRNRCRRLRSRGRGVQHLLRVPYQRHSVSRRGAITARGNRYRHTRIRGRALRRSVPASRTQTATTSCCSKIFSESVIPKSPCPKSLRMRGGGV